MTTQTPEQIAADVMDRHLDPENNGLYGPDLEITTEDVQTLIVSAIEADRAQHKDRLEHVTVHAKELDDPALRCDVCGDELCTAEEGDTVAILAAVALTHGDTGCTPRAMCDNCDERIEPDDMHAGEGMCGSCNHNAARSGA